MGAVPNTIAVFCNSLMPYFPVKLFRYCLGDFEIVLAAPRITGIRFDFTLYFFFEDFIF
jgi:hypothetical protein